MEGMVMKEAVRVLSRNEHETGDSGPDNGENAFDYDWCEVEPNAICTELPEFQEPSGPSQEARNANTPLECFSFSLLLHW